MTSHHGIGVYNCMNALKTWNMPYDMHTHTQVMCKLHQIKIYYGCHQKDELFFHYIILGKIHAEFIF